MVKRFLSNKVNDRYLPYDGMTRIFFVSDGNHSRLSIDKETSMGGFDPGING